MATKTTTVTVYEPVPVPSWGAAAQTIADAHLGQMIELVVPWGAQTLMALVDQPDTSLTPTEYAAQYGSMPYIQVGFDRTIASVRLVDPEAGVNELIMEQVVTDPPVVMGTVRLGVWLRLLRRDTSWGVQVLSPEPDETGVANEVRTFDLGQDAFSQCRGIQWTGDALQSTAASLQVWLHGTGDVVHTVESGLTGEATFSDTSYWGGHHDVQVAARQVTTSDATAELSAAATSHTRGEATPQGVAEGKTLTRAPHVTLATATSTNTTRAAVTYVAPVTAPATHVAAEAQADPFIAGSMAFELQMSDHQRLEMPLEMPPLEGEMRFDLATDVQSTKMLIEAVMPALVQNGIYMSTIYYGDVDAQMPALTGTMADYRAGEIEGHLQPIVGFMWAAPGWRFSNLSAALDRWRFSKQHQMALSDEAQGDDELGILSDLGMAVDEAQANDAWSWGVSHVRHHSDVAEVADSMGFRTARGGDGDVVWSVNMDSGASSRYEGYDFNSFFELDGVTYGVADDGVYRLDGETDAGEAIESRLYTVQTDFDSDRGKYVPKVYFGGTSTRPILVEIDADGVTRTYQARNWSRNVDVHRVDCGMGVKANYWSVTLKNSEGADFAVDSLRMTPISTKRRV